MHDPRLNPRDGRAVLQCGRLLFLFALVVTGCRTAPPLPPADFGIGGWQVRQGQAIWKPAKNRPELAGEILVATQPNGDFVVQFSKTPFPLAAARVTEGQWQIEFGAGQRRFAGRGQPPSRLVWFQLPGALAGEGLRKTWHFTHPSAETWRLENRFTGESLEGGFFP